MAPAPSSWSSRWPCPGLEEEECERDEPAQSDKARSLHPGSCSGSFLLCAVRRALKQSRFAPQSEPSYSYWVRTVTEI